MIPVGIYVFIRGIAIETLLCYWTCKLSKKRKWDYDYEIGYVFCLIGSIVGLFFLGLVFVKQ